MHRTLHIALSTSWLPHLNLSPEDFLRVMGVFGIASFELNYQVHPLDLDVWRDLIERYQLTITSLHNICSADGTPLVPGNHYGDNLAHPDEETRLQSVRHLRATAEAARYLGAGAVVVHAGSHAGHYRNPGYTALLQSMREHASEDGLARIRQEVAELAVERKATVGPYLQRLVKSLQGVAFDFPAVQFGLENRYHYYGLPDIDELRAVMEEVGAENIGLWADLGHGQV
jgi:sugar phosphate isomerase/epimerase